MKIIPVGFVDPAIQEQEWVESEIVAANKEVRKHDDNHGRVNGTKPQWQAYRNALRDRVIGGVIQGDPSKAGRPSRPI